MTTPTTAAPPIPPTPTTAAPWTACLDTPDGPFTVVVGPDGVVLASGWTTDPDALVALIHPTLRPARLEPAEPVAPAGPGSPGFNRVRDAVAAYYAGDVAAIDAVPVSQVSGPFRAHAWDVLRAVAPGAPVSYARYAELCGRPAAIRAAAGACAWNAAALFVPCHRVLRTDGTLGGFRYGLDIKRRLLDREAAVRR